MFQTFTSEPNPQLGLQPYTTYTYFCSASLFLFSPLTLLSSGKRVRKRLWRWKPSREVIGQVLYPTAPLAGLSVPPGCPHTGQLSQDQLVTLQSAAVGRIGGCALYSLALCVLIYNLPYMDTPSSYLSPCFVLSHYFP